MQITKPTFYKEFSCIAGACPDTCCAGWQIMIDEKSLQKYRRFKGSFRNRLHNDIDWKEHSFCQYDKRCAFLNEDNLCDIYSEAGKDMLCDTCRKYPRHIEEFEGLREYSLSLSCPEAARIFLSHKEKITFFTREVAAPEETFDDFDYFLFTALMDTRDYLFSVIQDRSIPVRLRRQKLLACAHDFQLSLDKNELFQWEDICGRHQKSGYGEKFLNKIQKWNNDRPVSSEQPCKDSTSDTVSLLALCKQIWRTVWHTYLRKTLVPLYDSCQSDTELTEIYAAFAHYNDIMKPFLRKASFPVLYFLFLPGALLHTSTDHVQSSSYTLPLTLLKSSFSALRNIILSTFLLMQLQRQSVRVMKESHLLAGIIINPNRLTFYA